MPRALVLLPESSFLRSLTPAIKQSRAAVLLRMFLRTTLIVSSFVNDAPCGRPPNVGGHGSLWPVASVSYVSPAGAEVLRKQVDDGPDHVQGGIELVIRQRVTMDVAGVVHHQGDFQHLAIHLHAVAGDQGILVAVVLGRANRGRVAVHGVAVHGVAGGQDLLQITTQSGGLGSACKSCGIHRSTPIWNRTPGPFVSVTVLLLAPWNWLW